MSMPPSVRMVPKSSSLCRYLTSCCCKAMPARAVTGQSCAICSGAPGGDMMRIGLASVSLIRLCQAGLFGNKALHELERLLAYVVFHAFGVLARGRFGNAERPQEAQHDKMALA